MKKGPYQPIHSQNNIVGADGMARGMSPYLGVEEDKFGQHGKQPIQSTIAAEIKVNRTKILNNQGDAYGYSSQAPNNGASQPTNKSGMIKNTSTTPIRPKYDTRDEDGLILNSN